MNLTNSVHLLCYPDRIGTNLSDLNEILSHLSQYIGGVHILPIYPSNADAGFSPITHKKVAPHLGNWQDIENIAQKFDLCLDITLNHISDESPEFKDFIAHGFDSEYADMFIHINELGPITKEDLAKIHIRKEKEPFRQVTLANGDKDWVWCTFTDQQIDLDYTSRKTYHLMEEYLTFLLDRGVKLFRLDAFGYITKEIGTSCFLLEPDTYDHLTWFKNIAQRNGADILPEVHDHPSYQQAISSRDMYSYGFALPPLVLYTYLYQNTQYLKNWLRVCPYKQVTVLDTHDGICIPDVEGIIPESNLQNLVEDLDQRSGQNTLRKTAGSLHSVGAIYQINATFFDAMRQDEDAYIGSRAIQFFTPGIPQVYYVGLQGGKNDYHLADTTGEPRDINRHFYTKEDWYQGLNSSLSQRLLHLMEFRNTYPAFQGVFELHSSDQDQLKLVWRHDSLWCQLDIHVIRRSGTITYLDPKTHTQETFEI